MEREAAERAADVLLAVAPHQLGDLRAEPGVDLGVALGVVGQEVDRRELDRLQERAGLPARSIAAEARVRSLAADAPAIEPGAAPSRPSASDVVELGQPDLIRVDLEPAGQPGSETRDESRRASRPAGPGGPRGGCSRGSGAPSPGRAAA